jgi:hypothetical protein
VSRATFQKIPRINLVLSFLIFIHARPKVTESPFICMLVAAESNSSPKVIPITTAATDRSPRASLGGMEIALISTRDSENPQTPLA